MKGAFLKIIFASALEIVAVLARTFLDSNSLFHFIFKVTLDSEIYFFGEIYFSKVCKMSQWNSINIFIF